MTLTTQDLFCDTLVLGPADWRDTSLSAFSTSEAVQPMTRAVFGGLLCVIYTCLKDGSTVLSCNILMPFVSCLWLSTASYLVFTHSRCTVCLFHHLISAVHL